MVVPIRDLGNITSITFANCEITFNISANKDVVMGGKVFDHLFQDASNNYDEVQGHSLVHNTYGPRILFMSLSKCKESYAERLEKQNNIIVEKDHVITFNYVSTLST